MRDATNFSSETHKSHFITILKHINGIALKTWERVSIVDNTNANFKIVRRLKIYHDGCCTQI